jgi:SAM-dependent methyltransferase
VFDEQREEWALAREQLRELAGEHGYEAARRTTINAHYSDPRIAAAIWQAVSELGCTGGRVLEPGCGPGIFLGLAPPGTELVGIELDPTTARIARTLYPDADIRTESFAATRLPDGYFDLAIGNVPFADVRLHDPRHNPGGHSLHNHFILKSLALTRPGGLVAVLTSHYTLDAANPAVRREMNALADLVGTVRLPTGAHRRTAGTDALMDLLILRRREPGQPVRDTGWETTQLLDVDCRQMRINSHLAEHPELILGELTVDRGMHGAEMLHVRPRGPLEDTPAELRHALDQLTDRARDLGLLAGPRDPSPAPAAADDLSSPVALASEGAWDGHIAALQDGTFTVTSDGLVEPLTVPRFAPRRATRPARAARHRPGAARRRGRDTRGHQRDRRAPFPADGPLPRVLAASSDDLAGERRRTLIARTAANDWDAVILTRSAFARLPV